jgi:organic hydroperoxide reductase OsmC/OhrA
VREGEVRVELQQQDGDRFSVHDAGDPSPAGLLGASVADCLAASLLRALRASGNEPGPMRAVATVTIERDLRGRLRIPRIAVDLHLGVVAGALRHAGHAIARYEDDCVVTQSVRRGIDVQARVWDAMGEELRPEP